MSIKIVKLTPANVEALNLMAPKVTSLVTTTKTTATFTGVDAYQASGMVGEMQAKAAAEYGKGGGPCTSLNAVRRKLLVLADAEQANEDRMRAESAKVEAMRDSGVLADDLAAAKARSQARAEQDAATDPLMVLLNNTTRTPAPASSVDDAPRERAFRVSGRLMAASKSGQRRPKRSRRGR